MSRPRFSAATRAAASARPKARSERDSKLAEFSDKIATMVLKGDKRRIKIRWSNSNHKEAS